MQIEALGPPIPVEVTQTGTPDSVPANVLNSRRNMISRGESKKEAEQQAAYSVSQSFSDETCAALLDKVDRLRLGGESR